MVYVGQLSYAAERLCIKLLRTYVVPKKGTISNISVADFIQIKKSRIYRDL